MWIASEMARHPTTHALRFVLRKNLLLSLRNKRDLVREIGVPLFLLVVLAIVSSLAREPEQPAVIDYPTLAATTPRQLLSSNPSNVWFAPCIAAGGFVWDVAANFSASTGANVTCFPCEVEGDCAGSLLEAYQWPEDDLLAAVVIDSSSSLPITYRLRMNAERYAPGAGSSDSTPSLDSNGLPLPPNTGASSEYLRAIVPLQLALNDAIDAALNLPPPPTTATLFTRQFPSPAYDGGPITSALVIIVPIYMTLIFTLQVRVLLTRILEEKERKVTIMLKLMGLSDEVWWQSWAITIFLKNFPLIVLVALIACYAGIFTRADASVIFVLFVLFEFTCVGFGIGISSLFSKSKSGGVFGMIAYLSLALPSYAFSVGLGSSIGAAPKLVLCLLAPFAFNLSISVVMKAQQLHRRVDWSSISDPSLSPLGVSLGSLMGMLALDAVLYLALSWYLTKVVQSEFGTTAHPLFCCGRRRKPVVISEGDLCALRTASASSSQNRRKQRRGCSSSIRGCFMRRCRSGGDGGAMPTRLQWLRSQRAAPARNAPSAAVRTQVEAGARTQVEVNDVEAGTLLAGATAGPGTSSFPASASPLQLQSPSFFPASATPLPALPGFQLGTDPQVEVGVRARPTVAEVEVGRSASLLLGTGECSIEPVSAATATRDGVHVRGLSKVFRDRKTTRLAVDDLSLSFYEGQVTCLLGHNGAGKSTTISILTGMLPPSAGDAIIYGRSILSDMPSIRRMIGVCQQEDIILDQLTVEEHLVLYGGIRGLSGPSLHSRIDELLEELGLAGKKRAWAKTLSGGQLRRMSIAAALIGDPRVLFLDEPTSGLDPITRRRVWGLIQKYKANRVVILTTHFMEEADILGDRISIMARGKLRVCGTSLHLKNLFGLGYRLLVAVPPAHPAPTASEVEVAAAPPPTASAEVEVAAPSPAPALSSVLQQLNALVAEHVPGASAAEEVGTTATSTSSSAGAPPRSYSIAASASSDAGHSAPPPRPPATATASHSPSAAAETEVTVPVTETAAAAVAVPGSSTAAVPSEATEALFVLPRTAVSRFAALFDALDALQATGRILHYSVSISTLEEIYLRVSSALEAEEEEGEGEGADVEPLLAIPPPSSLSLSVVVDTPAPSAATATRSAAIINSSTISGSGGANKSTYDSSPHYWLDVSRRQQPLQERESGHGGDCDDSSKSSAAAVSPPSRSSSRRSPRVCGQIAAHVWRRELQMQRDIRSIWLQWVTPLLFVAAGIILTLLKDTGGSASAARVFFTPSQFLPLGPTVFPVFASSSLDADPLASVAAASRFASFYAADTAPGTPLPMLFSTPLNDSAVDGSLLQLQATMVGGASAAAAAVFSVASGVNATVNITLLYNTSYTNVIPIMVSLIHNALAAAAANGSAFNGSVISGSSSSNFNFVSSGFDPLPLTAGTGETDVGNFLSLGLIGLAIALGFNTLAAIQAVQVVEERENKCKQLSTIMGESPTAYWAATWLWDVLQFLVPGVGTLIIIGLGTGHDFHHLNIYALGFLLLAFGIALPGPVYALSFAFSSHVSAQMYTRLGFSALTLGLFFISFGLEYPPLLASFRGQGDLALALRYIFMLFPPYALAKGVADIGIMSDCNEAVELAGYRIACETVAPFSWPVAGSKIVWMLLTVPFWAVVIMRPEGGGLCRRNAAQHHQPDSPSQSSPDSRAMVGGNTELQVEFGSTARIKDHLQLESRIEDDDVRAERRRIDALQLGTSAELQHHTASAHHGAGMALRDQHNGIVLRGLRKVFPDKRRGGVPIVAVADLSLQCKPGDILGILGHNGAGKTTTLSVLVGEQHPTRGTINIFGVDAVRARRSALDMMGYCPQSDALFGLLTGAEILRFYALLSGAVDEEIARVVAQALKALDLDRLRNVLVKNYSGGNKRRLSLAVAYITAPLAVLLDEPSTGVDPVARHRMFDIISHARVGRSTLLTTHVMEDADALCNSIAVMAEGRCAALGSPAHLKAKYGRGYMIHLLTDLPVGSRVPPSDASTSKSSDGSVGGRVTTSTSNGSVGGNVDVVEAIRTVLLTSASSIELVEENCGHLAFSSSNDVSLSRAFRAIEGARDRLAIHDFSLCETSLEQVFLAIGRKVSSLGGTNQVHLQQ